MIDDVKRKQLLEPFPPGDIEWRVQKKVTGGAMLCAYLTARAVMDRLDAVFGVGGWEDSYETIVLGKDAGFMCTLTCDGVSKQDISDLSDIESLKGGVSGALKRAAVKFGVGRYLYDLPNTFAKEQQGYAPRGVAAISGQGCHYLIPELPAFAKPTTPQGVDASAPEDKPHDPTWGTGGNREFMGKLSAKFGKLNGHSYDMLVDFLESLGKDRPSQMPVDRREALVKWLTGPGEQQYTTFISKILSDRESQQ